MTPTRLGTNGATQTSGWLPKPASRAPGVDDRRLDEVGRDLDARDEVAAPDDLAVEGREDLERVDPVEALEVGDPDVERRRPTSASRSTRLWAGPRDRQPRPGDGRRQTQRRLVLVQLARLPGRGR